MNNGDAEFIIGLLGEEFDSHDFIQKYLKHFPTSYGQLLEKHDNTATANAEIANYLRLNAVDLNIERVDKTTSRNVLNNESENTWWRKIG